MKIKKKENKSASEVSTLIITQFFSMFTINRKQIFGLRSIPLENFVSQRLFILKLDFIIVISNL